MTKLDYHALQKAMPALEECAAPCRVMLDQSDYGFQLGVGVEWPSEYRAAIRLPTVSGGGYVKETRLQRLWRVLQRKPRERHPSQPRELEPTLIEICSWLAGHGRAAKAMALIEGDK